MNAQPVEPAPEPRSFDEFRRGVPFLDREGLYLLSGDTPVLDEAELRRIYDASFPASSTPTNAQLARAELLRGLRGAQDDSVMLTQDQYRDALGNVRDSTWPASIRRNLNYCVSTAFGEERHRHLVAALAVAAQDWATVIDVRFPYTQSADANCVAANGDVVFRVEPTHDRRYEALAFFPDYPPQKRVIYVDDTAFSDTTYTLAGLLRHELGHVLGFRHEHIRPEARPAPGDRRCVEDPRPWRSLTPYDSESVMHYPYCGGTASSWTFQLSRRDVDGARLAYGPPAVAPPTRRANPERPHRAPL